MPELTLYFLQASRSIRSAWQLEELGLDYKLEFSERENQKAPQHFKDNSGDALGKFPLLKDGDLTIPESGAIAEYVPQFAGRLRRSTDENAADTFAKNTTLRTACCPKIPPPECNVCAGSTQQKEHTRSTPSQSSTRAGSAPAHPTQQPRSKTACQ